MEAINNIPNKKNIIDHKNLGKTELSFIQTEPFTPSNESDKLTSITTTNNNFDIPTIIREAINNNTYDVLTNIEDEESDEKSEESDVNKIFHHDKINNRVNHLFIGSLSIIGLFILYRLIQKTK